MDKLLVYQGQIVQVFAQHVFYRNLAQRADFDYGHPINSTLLEFHYQYCLRFRDGTLISWVVDDVTKDPGICAECSGPTIDDYL